MPRPRPWSLELRLALGLLLVFVAVLACVVLGQAADADGPAWQTLVPLLAVVYVAAGVLAWLRRPTNRIGPLLVLGGLAWMLAGLRGSPAPAVAAVGAIFATAPVAVLFHVLLAYPSGRLRGRADRAAVAFAYAAVFLFTAPTWLFGPGPGDELLQVADEPALVDLGAALRRWAGWIVGGVTITILIGRLQAASERERRVLGPLAVYGVAIVCAVTAVADLVPFVSDPSQDALLAIQRVLLAGLPVAFALAVARGGFMRSSVLDDLATWAADDERSREDLRSALARSLGDESIELAYRMPDGGFVGADGRPLTLPPPGGERGWVEVEVEGRVVAAIVHGVTLRGEPETLRAAAKLVMAAIERERLTAVLLASREALRRSRARIAETADRERRRIAQDLHDGLASQLLLIAIQAQQLDTDGDGGLDLERVGALRASLDAAIEALRALVRGVMPPALVEGGLEAAVHELADRMPVPTAVRIEGMPDALPHEVETTAYFVVAEALTNAAKHAGARQVTVEVTWRGGCLVLDVRDDGQGGAAAADGAGIPGIADRVDVHGGRVELDSPPGAGTRLRAEIPCDPATGALAPD